MIDLKIEQTERGTLGVSCTMDGSTDGLLDELAAGMAHAIIMIADDLPVIDEIHESLARVMASRVIDHVNQAIDLRGKAKDKPTEA